MRIIITGGTGFIGQALIKELTPDRHEIIVLSRSPQQKGPLPANVRLEKWDAKSADGWGRLADGADVIINLAGENLAGSGFFPARWTDKRKREIIESRVNAGRAVVEAVQKASKKPGLVLQASAVGYYGKGKTGEITEDAPPGDDFLADVCIQWEAATAPVEEMGVRRVVTRTGVILSFNDGALYRMALPFKLFVGGPLGSGRQPFPWIHPDDEVGAMRFLIQNETASGAYNLSAPNPLTNAAFARALGKVMRRPSYFPTPDFAFYLAFGEVAGLVLDGQCAVPRRLLEAGYQFKYPEVEAALRDLYRSGR